MADYTSKQAHMFAKLEHELGEPGKIAIDVTGVELQRKFDVLEDVMRTEVNFGVGVSWDAKKRAHVQRVGPIGGERWTRGGASGGEVDT